jgi:hypothetical protein
MKVVLSIAGLLAVALGLMYLTIPAPKSSTTRMAS